MVIFDLDVQDRMMSPHCTTVHEWYSTFNASSPPSFEYYRDDSGCQ